ncbi:MAG: zinc-ribbon domain-containing protein, partial [Candidatus Odinarchaeota archaeon]
MIPRYCTECGNPLKEEYEYCINCGKPVQQIESFVKLES